jgi:excisionase family DNA binding protein
MNLRGENDSEILSIREVAAVLNVSVASLKRWIAEDRVIAVRRGHSIGIPRNELERLLAGPLRPVCPTPVVK